MSFVLATAMTLGLVLGPALGGCGASGQGKEFGALPPRVTTATLAGPLCEGEVCKCRGPGRDPGVADRPGIKRYEVKIGPVDNELWVRVNSMVLYKSRERATECFYVDLPAGRHPVSLRASGEVGFAARLSIAEIGAQGVYDTFDFACGGPATCELDQLKEWHASLARYKRNIHDPCGSTRIRDVEWLGGDTPDRIHPREMRLDLVLDVYDFTPKHAPGDPACAGNY